MKIQISRSGYNLTKGLSKATGLFISFIFCAVVIGMIPMGCVDPDAPVVAAEPGPQEMLMGDFMAYKVANGDVRNLDGNPIYYRVGEIEFLPSIDESIEMYNYNYIGDGSDYPEQTIFYQEFSTGGDNYRGGSDNPEAIVLEDKLYFYYTNKADTWSLGCGTGTNDNGGTDSTGDTWDTATYLTNFPNCFIRGGIHNPSFVAYDIDWYSFDATAGTTFHVTLRANQFRHYGYKRKIRLSLYLDPESDPLVTSRYGMDYYYYDDPELGKVLTEDGTYYLKIEEIPRLPNADPRVFYYYLSFEATPSFEAEERGYVYKAEIQPARNGNPDLDGGETFEPDDTATKVEDRWPDCDGIPGTGDEGDWGIYEICYQPSPDNVGYQDGSMQFWEVDDRSAIDDGEWFKGLKTNIATWVGDEAPTVIKNGDELLMWLNIGGSIYQARSTDGLVGLNWDLSDVFADRATLRPRSQTDFEGEPEAPVISSGIYGYCESTASGDDVQVVEEGKGYPYAIGIVPGSDGVLDTFPQQDTLNVSGDRITTGPDGLINTFFVPSSYQYCFPYYEASFNAPADLKVGELGPFWNPLIGTGNPDAFAAADVCSYSAPGYDVANDRTAYLMGDDEWADTLPVTPAEYWRNKRCNLFSLAEEFNRCAMGVPYTEAINQGGDDKLDTVEELLEENNDQLCHDGDTVGICRGEDNHFGYENIEWPLLGDDVFCIRTDPELGDSVVAICPGPNNHLDSMVVGINSGTGVSDPFDTPLVPVPGDEASEWVNVHDVLCGVSCSYLSSPNQCSICPGDDGAGRVRLDSAWSLYYSHGPDELAHSDWTDKFNDKYSPAKSVRYYYEADIYYTNDDELCIINGEIALCAGPNGYFQSYPLHIRKTLEHWPNYTEMIIGYKGTPDDCQELKPVEIWDEFYDTTTFEYYLYEFSGLLFDDEIIWDDARQEYVITTGANGVNQSCVSDDDRQMIKRFRGKADMPIITPGADVTWQTMVLSDEKNYLEVENEEDIERIDTGPDGIMNSFAIGDDVVNIYLGTGRADMPCILAGENGIAESLKSGNDNQLYEPGEKTGFDAFYLATPEVVKDGDDLYLYYSALGWLKEPDDMHRPDRGSYNIRGGCEKAGMDAYWGKKEQTYDWFFSENPDNYYRSFLNFNGSDNLEFALSLDNNPGVLLKSRIGVAKADLGCVEDAFGNEALNPEDCWERELDPAIDVGAECGEALDFFIDLSGLGDFEMPGTGVGFGYSGFYQPDVWVEYEENSGNPVFNMFLTGLGSNQEGDGAVDNTYPNIGLARSIDGINWDVEYDISPMMNVAELLGGEAGQFHAPTIVRGQGDTYGMFYQQFTLNGRAAADLTTYFRRSHAKEWLGYAVRKGMYYPACSLKISGADANNVAYSLPGVIAALIVVIPFLLFIGIRIMRRVSQS